MQVVIMTPMTRLFESHVVTKLRVMLDDGSWLSLYEKHAPMIAAVAACEVQIRDSQGDDARIAIGEGVLHLREGVVTIYVNQTPQEDSDAPVDMALETIDRLSEQLMQLLAQEAVDASKAG